VPPAARTATNGPAVSAGSGVPVADTGMTLAEQTARRLLLAGITPDDPGLAAIREWNARVYQRAGLPNPHDTTPGEVTMTPSYRPGRIRSGAGTPDP
jgi:hypothetical protein